MGYPAAGGEPSNGMNAVAVLVHEHDARARGAVALCDGAIVRTLSDRAGADVALASTPAFADDLRAAPIPVPVIVLDTQDAVALGELLRSTVELARVKSKLIASLDELEQQRAALLQLSTLKSDLIATLAHDIKGPLTSIVGFAELMEEGYLEGVEAQDAARTIRANAQRLAALATDMLALSRVEHGELEIADDRVNLRDVLSQCVADLGADRDIELAIEPAETYVRGDAERLRQVFENLVRNAVQYSPNGEPVRVHVVEREQSFVIDIVDRGIGIPPDEMHKLFQRFGRTTNARKSKIAGTGVGLFIVKTIVERHGGSVSVQSTLGGGSTFTVLLPALESRARVVPARVAVVTPDARIRRFTAYELRSRGYRVLEVATLEDAMKAIGEGDIALVDVDLGDAVRARAMLASASRVIGLGGVFDGGWDGKLSKPFLVTDLLGLLAGRTLARQ
jgi:signal transduction histidine kinase